MPRKKVSEAPANAPLLAAVPKPKAPRVTKAKAVNVSATDSFPPSYEEIAEAAYLRFLERGGGHGNDFDDWLAAERDLFMRRGLAKAV